jgi:hypothetical protein
LKAGHFNESLAQKPATSMQEIIKRAECYIKGEESNAEKRTRDAREMDPTDRGNRAPDFYQQTEDPIYQIMIAQLLRNLHNLMMPLSLQMMSPEAIKLL